MTHAIYDMAILVPPTESYLGIVKLIDQSEHYGTLTITNDVEYVVSEVGEILSRTTEYEIGDYILIYQDTDGKWDGIGVRNGKFDDFVLLETRDFREACHRMNDMTLGLGTN